MIIPMLTTVIGLYIMLTAWIDEHNNGKFLGMGASLVLLSLAFTIRMVIG